jgi:DNA-directed RNA polymerase subunit RPC12/RpoP
VKQYKYQEITKEDWIKTIIYVAVFIAVIIIGAIFLLPAYLYVWLIVLAGSSFLLVRWHATNFAYRCLKCGHEFEISTFTDFISPHGPSRSGGWKYLKCPECHERSRATLIKKV